VLTFQLPSPTLRLVWELLFYARTTHDVAFYFYRLPDALEDLDKSQVIEAVQKAGYKAEELA